MKKISLRSIAVFATLFFAIIGLSTLSTYSLLWLALTLPLQFDFIYFIVFMFFAFFWAIVVLRIWLKLFPTPVGLVPDEQVWHVHVYQLFYLILVNPLVRGTFWPAPFLRLIHLALGAKMDDNSYSGGVIYDCHLVKIGKNCILGDKTLLTPHQIEGNNLGYYPIMLGDNVTVGAHAVILPDCKIESGATLASGSVLTKGSHILQNEIWGGVPAKKIK